MSIEADVSRPSKRFVLPYEPEYMAYRRDDRVSRAAKLHPRLRDEDFSPPIKPGLSPPGRPAGEQKLQSADHRTR